MNMLLRLVFRRDKYIQLAKDFLNKISQDLLLVFHPGYLDLLRFENFQNQNIQGCPEFEEL